MDKSIYARFVAAINNIASYIMTGNRDREKTIQKLNAAFQDSFIQGDFDNLCSVEVCLGIPKYKNEYTHPHLKSGLRITILNDKFLSKGEIITYARPFGASDSFVISLLVLGFDSLILQPKFSIRGQGPTALQIGLKNFLIPKRLN